MKDLGSAGVTVGILDAHLEVQFGIQRVALGGDEADVRHLQHIVIGCRGAEAGPVRNVRRTAVAQAPDRVHRQVQQLRHRAAQQRWLASREDFARAPVGAHHRAALVEGQHDFARHVDQPEGTAQPQDPVAAKVPQEVGVLDHPRVDRHQVPHQVLALARLGRAQRRHVEDRRELAAVIEQRRRRAGERDVRGVEVLGLVAGHRLALDEAGAHAAGAGVRLVPVGAQVQAGAAQLVVPGRVADVVDRDALGVGQQHHVADVSHAPVDVFHARARGAQEMLQLLLVRAHLLRRQDARGRRPRRIEPVVAHAARPRLVHQARGRIGPQRAGGGDRVDVVDVTRLQGRHAQPRWNDGARPSFGCRTVAGQR
ncbi:hypothetical protein D9M69_483870 [compost metagenome]